MQINITLPTKEQLFEAIKEEYHCDAVKNIWFAELTFTDGNLELISGVVHFEFSSPDFNFPPRCDVFANWTAYPDGTYKIEVEFDMEDADKDTLAEAKSNYSNLNHYMGTK